MPTKDLNLRFTATASGASLLMSKTLNLASEVTGRSVLCCFLSIKKSPSCTLFLSALGIDSHIKPSGSA